MRSVNRLVSKCLLVSVPLIVSPESSWRKGLHTALQALPLVVIICFRQIFLGIPAEINQCAYGVGHLIADFANGEEQNLRFLKPREAFVAIQEPDHLIVRQVPLELVGEGGLDKASYVDFQFLRPLSLLTIRTVRFQNRGWG